MQTKRMSLEDFTSGMRDAVLEALDAYMHTVTDCDNAKGWRDSDLPELFVGIDGHAKRVAARFNDAESTEVGSANLSIDA